MTHILGNQIIILEDMAEEALRYIKIEVIKKDSDIGEELIDIPREEIQIKIAFLWY